MGETKISEESWFKRFTEYDIFNSESSIVEYNLKSIPLRYSSGTDKLNNSCGLKFTKVIVFLIIIILRKTQINLNYNVKVKNIDLLLRVNNKIISNFNSNSVLNLPANSNKIYNIKISVNNFTVITTILEVLADKNIVAAVTGDITTDLGTVNIDFRKEINF